MNTEMARKLAETLIDRHLTGWSFEFDRSVRRFGCCKYNKRLITLSRDITSRNDVEHVRDTILHEIAHALVGPGEGHGPKWKRECVRIGATPKACYDSEKVATKTAPYILRCECGEQQLPRHRQRKPKSLAACCRKPFYFVTNKEVFA